MAAYCDKWNWMMEWCKSKCVSPANAFFWAQAEIEYNKHFRNNEPTPSN